MLGFLWVSGTIDGDNKHGNSSANVRVLFKIFIPNQPASRRFYQSNVARSIGFGSSLACKAITAIYLSWFQLLEIAEF